MITRDFLRNEWAINCMGCDIASQIMSVPGGFIKETQNFRVHQDPLIPLLGFLVIASARHIKSITEMHATEYEEFSILLKNTVDAIKKATETEFLTIVQEEYSIHFHMWFFPWTEALLEKYRQPSLTSIRQIMADQRQKPISETEWNELKKSIEKIKAQMT